MADRSEMGHDLRRAYDGLDESWIQLYPDAERHAGRVRRYLRQHKIDGSGPLRTFFRITMPLISLRYSSRPSSR